MLRIEAATQLGAFSLDVSLEVPPGDCLALVGPSGAGKTTALRVAAGLLRPDTGRVTCADEVWLDTERGRFTAPERRRCAYLFQDGALFGHMRAWQNVAYGMAHVPRRERRAQALQWLARFGIDRLADTRPGSLSGGERRRVALARALAREPQVLLLDEPLTALDPRTKASASRELAEVLRAVEVPALLVTHDFAEAAQLGDRVAVLDGGRVVQKGTAAQLAAAPASGFVADLTGAAVLHGVASAGEDGLTRVAVDGGGEVVSTDTGSGPVAAAVYPWEIELAPPGAGHDGSARNRLHCRVASVTVLGNRVRVGLQTPQPFHAELTERSASDLALTPGAAVTATWKAAATRLSPR